MSILKQQIRGYCEIMSRLQQWECDIILWKLQQCLPEYTEER